jgi:hypothetical protein
MVKKWGLVRGGCGGWNFRIRKGFIEVVAQISTLAQSLLDDYFT